MANLSDFPNAIDNFNVLSDLTLDDIDNKKEYKILMNMDAIERNKYPDLHNDVTWQERVDELRILLEGKILMSTDITKLQDAILNMQEYILSNEIYIGNTPPLNPPTNSIWIDTN